MLICSRTGRTITPGDGVSLLTKNGFTEGTLESIALDGTIRVRSDDTAHEVRFSDVEAVWPRRAAAVAGPGEAHSMTAA